MNTNTEAKKLDILPEKIIHILLKHLMLQQNENEYVNNNAAINSFDNPIPIINDDINELSDAVADKKDDIKEPGNAVANIKDGIKEPGNAVANIKDGIEWTGNAVTKIKDGIEWTGNAITNIKDGIEWTGNAITDKKDGIEWLGNVITDKKDGINYVFNELSAKRGDANLADEVYAIFERGLVLTLHQYAKTAHRQPMLFKYYTDFMDAINQINNGTWLINGAFGDAALPYTHTLPPQITPDYDALIKLKAALYGRLPRTSEKGLYTKVASELLLLHNAGKATSFQLRRLTGLSQSGFSKHMPKMLRCGLIKKQPPGNYALTESSKHILLKTFGVPKNK